MDDRNLPPGERLLLRLSILAHELGALRWAILLCTAALLCCLVALRLTL